METVRAKFQCTNIQDFPEYNQKKIQFWVVTSWCEENQSFSKYTPSGEVWMNVSYETPAIEFFELGKEYYLDFTKAN